MSTYNSKAYQLTWREVLSRKLTDYKLLVKLRLTSIVVFSAGIGYLFATNGAIDWFGLTMILLGGFLVTGASNAFNEIIEKDTDRMMDRTAGRPLPAGRMTVLEAVMIAGIMAVLGIAMLGYFFNTLAAMVGAMSLMMYSFIYTPLKRFSNLAVFVGAIPGALPPVIGWISYTGSLEYGAILLFAIQFLWQFPHFWSIAWVSHEDYKKAGFHLLPSSGGRDKTSAFQNLVYITFLIPVSLLPFIWNLTGWISAGVALVAGAYFLWQALQLFWNCDVPSARKLMFGSFVYLPLVFLALVMDKI